MQRNTLAVMGVSLALLGVSAAGCCEKEKNMISQLEQELGDMSQKNQQLQSELAQCRARQADLEDRLQTSQAARQSSEAELARLRAEMSQSQVPGGMEWERGLAGDRVSVGSDILFASGKADLTASGRAKLDEIVRDLRRSYRGLPVRVYGYTDSDPIRKTRELWADNLDLSANRAMAVTRYLREQGIDAETIETIAMGATRFVAPNATPTGKAKNRRVEIIVIKTGQ